MQWRIGSEPTLVGVNCAWITREFARPLGGIPLRGHTDQIVMRVRVFTAYPRPAVWRLHRLRGLRKPTSKRAVSPWSVACALPRVTHRGDVCDDTRAQAGLGSQIGVLIASTQLDVERGKALSTSPFNDPSGEAEKGGLVVAVTDRQLMSAEDVGRTVSRIAHQIIEKTALDSQDSPRVVLLGIPTRGVDLPSGLPTRSRNFPG